MIVVGVPSETSLGFLAEILRWVLEAIQLRIIIIAKINSDFFFNFYIDSLKQFSKVFSRTFYLLKVFGILRFVYNPLLGIFRNFLWEMRHIFFKKFIQKFFHELLFQAFLQELHPRLIRKLKKFAVDILAGIFPFKCSSWNYCQSILRNSLTHSLYNSSTGSTRNFKNYSRYFIKSSVRDLSMDSFKI